MHHFEDKTCFFLVFFQYFHMIWFLLALWVMLWVYEFEGKIRFCKNKEEIKYLSCLYTCISVSFFFYFADLIIKNTAYTVYLTRIRTFRIVLLTEINMFPLLIISLGAPDQCAYTSLGCFQKKITPYRNFFRNLNFKNIVIFLRGHVGTRNSWIWTRN